MKTLVKVWNYLNGKKTILGTVAATTYYALVQYNVIVATPRAEALIATAVSLGLAHKAFKA